MKTDRLIEVLAAALEARKDGADIGGFSPAVQQALEDAIQPSVQAAIQKALQNALSGDSFRRAVRGAINPGRIES